MPRTQIILNVHGGLVQDVFCSDPDVEVTLVDWDTEAHGRDEPELVEIQTHSGREERAYVTDYPTDPFSDLAGTDVALALEQVEVCDGQT